MIQTIRGEKSCDNIFPKSDTDNFCRNCTLGSLILVTGDSQILWNYKSSKFLGFSNYTFCNFLKQFENYSLKAETLSVFGNVPYVYTAFQHEGSNIYQLQTSLPLNKKEQEITFTRMVTEICFNRFKDFDIEIITGINTFFSYDINYGFKGGWYRENYRNYVANGNIQNVQNIPILLDGVGIQFKYNTQKITLYGDIINDNTEATENIENTNGFFEYNSKNLCDLGLTYKTKNFCKNILNFHFQNYVCGARNISNRFPSITFNAFQNLEENMENKDNYSSYSMIDVIEFKNNIELSGAVSCINTQGKNDKGRLLMWSLGLLAKCKQLKCFSNKIPSISYGLNIATPLYVYKNILNNNRYDGTPIVCEISLFTNIGGLNIPITFSIYPKLPTVKNITGKAFIMGCRPYYLKDLHTNNIWKENKCHREGCIP